MFEIIVFLLCTILAAFFSASETSFTVLNKTVLGKRAKAGDRRAGWILWLWEKPERFFTPVLIGTDLAEISASVALTAVFLRWWGPLGALTSAILVTIIMLFWGELLPKGVAARFPLRLSQWLFYPLLAVIFLLYPFSLLFNLGLSFLRKIFPSLGKSSLLSREELEATARAWGKLEERQMLNQALRFSQKSLEDIMVPRIDIVAFPREKPVLEILEGCKDMRFSRLPLYDQSIDQIVGVLYLKDLLGKNIVPANRADEFARSPLFLVQNLSLPQALEKMRSGQSSLAIVVDDYGGVAGLVTMEDLAEEIVGEIWDEYDRPAVEVETLQDGGYLLDARTPIRSLEERWGLKIKSNSLTVGGALTDVLGRIPRRGEEIALGPVHFKILEASNKAVKRVLMHF